MKRSSLILGLLLPLWASAQPYSIDWFKIAGGGGTSTGGVYTVSDTAGQPDAGGSMTGGNYSLAGGFWALFAVQTPGAPYLRVTRTPSNTICVWWPVSDPAWKLQTCAALVSSGSTWTECSYQTNGPNCGYLEPAPTGTKFYRLQKP